MAAELVGGLSMTRTARDVSSWRLFENTVQQELSISPSGASTRLDPTLHPGYLAQSPGRITRVHCSLP